MDAILNISNNFPLWSAYYVPVILLDPSVYNYFSKQAYIFTTANRRYFIFEATSYPANYLASYSHASDAKSQNVLGKNTSEFFPGSGNMKLQCSYPVYCEVRIFKDLGL